MKILLIDDSVQNRRAGKRQLEEAGHVVTALASYKEGRDLAKTEAFDAALIDLLMPAESFTLGTDAMEKFAGKEEGIGFPLMIELARLGIPQIALATDTNHHNHPLSAMIDWFASQAIKINNSIVKVFHAPMSGGVKDWRLVLKWLTTE
jgi:CheY-like chemotaxis protein